MLDLQKISRAVYGHQWADLTEWVGALHALADLTDQQIEDLTGGALSSEAIEGHNGH